MKIAIAKGTKGDSQMDPRFGRTAYIFVYDDNKDEISHFDNRAIENAAHGAGPQTARKIFDLNPDILITGNGPGGNAARVLEQAGMKIFIGAGAMTVKGVFDAYRKSALKEF